MSGRIDYYVGVRWATIAVVAAAAVGAATIPVVTGGSGGDAYNLFIESGAGSCSPAVPAVTFADIGSNAVDEQCGSAQDAVNATSGHVSAAFRGPATFGAQSVGATTRTCSGTSTEFHEDGGDVTLGSVSLSSTDCTRWYGMLATGGVNLSGASGANKAVGNEFHDMLTQDGINANATSDFVWSGGDICCVFASNSIDRKLVNFTGSGSGASNNNQNALIENVAIHELQRADPSVHSECGFFIGVQGLTIRNTHWYDCGGYNLSLARIGSDPDPADVLIENSTFEPADNNSGGAIGGEDAFNCMVFDHVSVRYAGLIIRNNSISCPIQWETADVPDATGYDQTFVYSNVLNNTSCTAGSVVSPTYRNNINKVSCGTGDVVSANPNTANYTATTSAPGSSWDFHLKSGAPAIGAASTTSGQFSTSDIGGNARDGDPDAGAYEFGSGS